MPEKGKFRLKTQRPQRAGILEQIDRLPPEHLGHVIRRASDRLHSLASKTLTPEEDHLLDFMGGRIVVSSQEEYDKLATSGKDMGRYLTPEETSKFLKAAEKASKAGVLEAYLARSRQRRTNNQ